MDDPMASTSSVQSPAATQPAIPGKPLWLAGGLAVLTFGATLGFFGAKFLNQSQAPSQLSRTPTPTQLPAPTSDPTADWKTYENFKWKFSVSYPSDKLVSCQYDQVGDGIKLWAAPFDCPDGHDIFYEVSVLGYSRDKLPSYKQPISSKNINVAGVQATKNIYKYENEDGPLQALGGATEILVPSSDGIIQLIVLSDNPAKVQHFDQILSTFKFTDETSSTPTSTINPKKLTYFLPQGWKTVTDTNGILQAAYDPGKFSATPGNQNIYLNNIQYPVSAMSVSLKPYDGGSRHQFIYNLLGYTATMAKNERMDNYYEKEYQYNGWNCLVLYDLGYSARGTTWGMCAVNSSQALFIEGSDQEATEKLISTIKIVR